MMGVVNESYLVQLNDSEKVEVTSEKITVPSSAIPSTKPSGWVRERMEKYCRLYLCNGCNIHCGHCLFSSRKATTNRIHTLIGWENFVFSEEGQEIRRKSILQLMEM